MARDCDAKCKKCRREGAKLFLKGDRCYSEKCALDRRNYPSGEHGQNRTKNSEYGLQLREKQKVRRTYGLLEKQFRLIYDKASRAKGVTGENMLQLLERRMDNVIYCLGFADSRAEARQLVRHNHFRVNNKKMNIPSFELRAGDVITVNEKSREIAPIVRAMGNIDKRGVPSWMELDKAAFKGTIKALPVREEIGREFQEQLVVELYSK